MTQKEIEDAIIGLFRNDLRNLARLKALESFIFDKTPSAERASAVKLLDEQTNRIFQVLLEDVEKQSPGFSALVDNRDPEELEGLDNPLT